MNKLIFCTLLCFAFMTSCNDDLLFTESDKSSEISKNSPTGLKRSCASESRQEKLLKDLSYRASFEKRLAKADQMVKSRSDADCSNPLVLPVAIHFQDVGNIDISCLRRLAQTQVDILNDDFSGKNADISKWNTVKTNYGGMEIGNACIQFCLPTQNHPSGYGLADGETAVTLNKTSGEEISDWAGYLNVYVQSDLGYLGESPLGGIGNGDGVLIDANAFGAGSGCGAVSPEAPFDKGRTLTHEMGHFLLLDHLWGDGGCNSSDDVADTPKQSEPNYGCPNAQASQCGSLDLHMSYMDYSDDACMYMFSKGQGDRVNAYVKANLQSVINKGNSVCGTTTDDPDTEKCDAPAGLSITATTSGSISFSWSNVSDADNFTVAMQELGNTGWNQKTTNQQTFTFQDLQEETTYKFRVRSICGSEVSSWKNIQATTSEEDKEDPDGCKGYGFTLKINFDDYPEETKWTLKDEQNGDVLFSGGPFDQGQAGKSVSTDFCLESACYVLEVTDEYGDGICCEYGDGDFEIIAEDGESVYKSDGSFGNSEQIFLCVKTSGQLRISNEKTAKKASLARKSRKIRIN